MKLTKEQRKRLFFNGDVQKCRVETSVANINGKFLVVSGTTGLFDNLKVSDEEFEKYGRPHGTFLTFEEGELVLAEPPIAKAETKSKRGAGSGSLRPSRSFV